MDDCSTDGSWEYLNQFEDHPKVSHCIRNKVNSGSPFKQWAKGLVLAKYDWIWIAESDDFSEVDFLLEAVKRIDSTTNLIFCKSELVDFEGDSIRDLEKKDVFSRYEIQEDFDFMSGSDFVSLYLSVNNVVLNASSALFRKPLIFPNKVSGMMYNGDWFFWIYILQSGGVKYISKKLNKFRIHEKSTRAKKSLCLEIKRYEEHFQCFDFSYNSIGRNDLILPNRINHHELVDEYIRLLGKLGRIRFSYFFPKVPIRFYLLYYSRMLKRNLSF